MATICPSCGSKELATDTSKKLYPIVYGKPAEWAEIVYHCLACGESGDFSDDNDSLAEKAIELAKKQSVNIMLDSLVERGLKMTYLERAFELPPKTIARWKVGGSSASSIALIRIIRTFPWIIDVADAHFDPLIAKKKLIAGAAQVLGEEIEINNGNVSLDVHHGNDGVSFYGKLVLDPAYQSLDLLQPMMLNLASIGE